MTSAPTPQEKIFPLIPQNKISVKSGRGEKIDYASSFLENAKNIAFTEAELLTITNAYGKILTIPEILARLKTSLRDKNEVAAKSDKASLLAWGAYLNRSIETLLSTPVFENLAPDHRFVLSWMQYNKDLALRIGNEKTILEASVASAITEHRSFYDANKDAINKNLRLVSAPKDKSWEKYFSGLVSYLFAPAVYGAEGIPFGGIISIDDTCLTGMLLNVSQPAAGVFFLYWYVYAANPYPYGLVTDGNWILGNAFPGPGICTHSLYDYYWAGEGMIEYFGTANQ